MIQSEGIGWIVVVGGWMAWDNFGWRYCRFESQTHIPPLFLYNWADSCWTISRLYSKGRVLGHKRAKRNTRPNTSLIQIEGVATKEDAQFYLGKVRNYLKDMLYSFFLNEQISVLPTSIKRKKKFKAQKSELSGGGCFVSIHTSSLQLLTFSQLIDE